MELIVAPNDDKNRNVDKQRLLGELYEEVLRTMEYDETAAWIYKKIEAIREQNKTNKATLEN